MIFMYAAMAQSWNVIAGFSGQIILAYVIFFGIMLLQGNNITYCVVRKNPCATKAALVAQGSYAGLGGKSYAGLMEEVLVKSLMRRSYGRVRG